MENLNKLFDKHLICIKKLRKQIATHQRRYEWTEVEKLGTDLIKEMNEGNILCDKMRDEELKYKKNLNTGASKQHDTG